MRLYFLRNGHIAAVELLETITDDQAAIRMGGARFLERLKEGFEGFEIWERDRVVFQYPPVGDDNAGPASKSGARNAQGSPVGGKQGRALPDFLRGRPHAWSMPGLIAASF